MSTPPVSFASLADEIVSGNFVFTPSSVQEVTKRFVDLFSSTTIPDPLPDREFAKIHSALTASADRGQIGVSLIYDFVRLYSVGSRSARFWDYIRKREDAQNSVYNAQAALSAAVGRTMTVNNHNDEGGGAVADARLLKARADKHLLDVSSTLESAEIDRT